MYDKLKKRLNEIVVEDEQKDVDQLEKVDGNLTDLPEGEESDDKKELPEGEELEESAKALKNVLDKDKLDKFAKRVAKKVNGREVQSIKIRKASRSEYMKKKATTLVGKALLFNTGATFLAGVDFATTNDYKAARNTEKLLHGAVAAGIAGEVAVQSDKFFLLEIVMKDVKKPLTFLIGDGKNEEAVKKEGANIISAVKKAIAEYTVKEDAWLIDETVESTEDEYFTEAQIVEFIPDGIFSIAEAETLEEAAKVDDKKLEKFAGKVAKKVNGREVQSIKIRKIKRSEYFKQLGKSLIVPGALIATGYGVAKAMEMGSKKSVEMTRDAIRERDVEKTAKYAPRSYKLNDASEYVKAGTQGAVRGTATAGVINAATLAFAYVLEVTLKDEKKPLIFTVGFGKEVESVGPKLISAVKKAISEYTVKEDTWLIEDDSVNEDFITLEDSLETVDHDADKEAEKAAKDEGEDQQEEIKLEEAYLAIKESKDELMSYSKKDIEDFAKKIAKKINGREVKSIKVRKMSTSELLKRSAQEMIIPGAWIIGSLALAKAIDTRAKVNATKAKKAYDSGDIEGTTSNIGKALQQRDKAKRLAISGSLAGTSSMVSGAAIEAIFNKFAYVLEVIIEGEKKPLVFVIGLGKDAEKIGPKVISAVKKAIAEYTVKEDAWLIEDDSVNEDFVFLEDSLETVEHDADEEAKKAAKAEGEDQQEEVPVKEDTDEDPGKVTKEDIYKFSRSIALKFKAKKIKKLEIRAITKGEVLKNSKANILIGAVFGAAGIFSIRAKDVPTAAVSGGASAIALAEVFARLKTAGNVYAIEAEFVDGKRQVVLLGALTGQALKLKNEIVKEVLRNHKDLNPQAYDNSLKESFLDFDQEETSKLIEEAIFLLGEDSLDTVDHDADEEAKKAAKAEGEDQQEEVPVKESWILEDGKLVQIEEFEF